MPGLFDRLFGGGGAQMPGTAAQPRQNPFQTLLDPAVALPMAAALLGSGGNAQNFAGALGAAGPALTQRKELQAQTAQKNATLEFLRKKAPELAQAVESGMPAKEAYGLYVAQLKAQGPTDTIRNMEWRAQQAGLQPGTPEYQDFMRSGGSRGGGVTYGKSPIWGADAEGNPVLGTIGDDGSFKRIETPEGFKPSPGVQRVDLGTAWGVLNREGNVVSTIPKDIAGEETQKARGKAAGEAQSALAGSYEGINRAKGLAEELLTVDMDRDGEPDWKNYVGPLQGRAPNVTGEAVAWQGRLDQLKGNAFLQARQELKGGGAITDFESNKAEEAMFRAQTAQSEPEFERAIKDFIDALEAGQRKLRAIAGEAAPAPEAQTPDNIDDLIEQYGGDEPAPTARSPIGLSTLLR